LGFKFTFIFIFLYIELNKIKLNKINVYIYHMKPKQCVGTLDEVRDISTRTRFQK